MADDAEHTYRLDDQVGYLLRLANQRHTAIFQDHALHGLTPTQFSALVRISEQKQCSQNHLGRLCGMDVATIKGVVDRLHQKGLTSTSPDPNDKRRALISLTGTGNALLLEMLNVGSEITAETLTPLNGDEQKTLLRLLKKIC